ncbi:MAG: hypothetical protein QW404_00630 [Candidatus Nanoarchaeia archaeon]
MLLWFLPAILFLGLISSYTDIKQGKIKNKHILIALIYAVVVYLIIISLSTTQVRVSYFLELIVMGILTLIVGFVIWYIGLWTAGDAKLFFAYSMLIPLSVYKYMHIPYFDSFNILINTFVPISFFLFIALLLRTSLRKKFFFLKEALKPKIVLTLAVSLFALSWCIESLFNIVNLETNYFITIPLLFLVIMLLGKFGLKNFIYIIVPLSVIRLIFDNSIYSFSFVKEFVLILLLFIFLRFFIIRMGFYLLTKEVDIKMLHPGMIPAELVYLDGNKYKKSKIMLFTIFDYLQFGFKKNYLFNPTEPLSNDDVIKLKKLEKKLGFEHLRVQQTVPFAPFLFLGVLLTIISQGNILIFIFRLFH